MGKKKRIHNLNRTVENDIRYRGPLSYRHLMIMGWIGIVFMVIGMWTSLGINLDPNSPDWMFTLNRVSKMLGDYALPLLLLSNYCIILDEKKPYEDLLKKNGALTLAVVAAYMLIFGRYLSGIINMFTNDSAKTYEIILDLLREGTRTGDLAFNLFIDLLLCTLFMFFLNYVPRKGFFAKHLLAFRYLAVLPVIYEVASLAIRILSSLGTITPSFYIYPFLTTKAPMSFIMFVALSLYIKVRERIFLKNGKTLQDYKDFLKTNANSWQFSVYASLILVVTCVIDMLLLIVFVTNASTSMISYIYSEEAYEETETTLDNLLNNIKLPEEFVNPDEDTSLKIDNNAKAAIKQDILNTILNETEAASENIQKETMPVYFDGTTAEIEEEINVSVFEMVKNAVIADAGKMTYAWGFGKHVPLIVLLPFLRLLSYTRAAKNKEIDLFIPPVGVILALLVSIECLYQGISMFLPNVIKTFVK